MTVTKRKRAKQTKDNARLKASARPWLAMRGYSLCLSVAIILMLLTSIQLHKFMQGDAKFAALDLSLQLLASAIGERPLPSSERVPAEDGKFESHPSPSATANDTAATIVVPATRTAPKGQQELQMQQTTRKKAGTRKEKAREKRKKALQEQRMRLKEELAYRRTLPVVPYQPTKEDLSHPSTVQFSPFCRAHNMPGFEFGPLADKHAIKSFVSSVAPDMYVAKEYANFVAANVTKLDDSFLHRLPARKFLIKATHASGAITAVSLEDDTVTCLKKPCLERLQNEEGIEPMGKLLQRLCRSYLRYNYAKFFKETQYSNIPQRCILEEFLDIGTLHDYKFHVFHGRPMLLAIYGSRFDNSHALTVDELTLDWKVIPVRASDPNSVRRPSIGPKPEFFDFLVETTKKLAVHAAEVAYYPYIRVDFFVYHSSNDDDTMPMQIAFSELTLTHKSCADIFAPHAYANHFYGYVGQHPELNISTNAILDFVQKVP